MVGRWLGGWTERGGGGHRGECWMFKHTRLFNLVPKIPHARETHHTCSPVPRGRVLSEHTRFLQPRGRDLGEQEVPEAAGRGVKRTNKVHAAAGRGCKQTSEGVAVTGTGFKRTQKCMRPRGRFVSEPKSACDHEDGF